MISKWGFRAILSGIVAIALQASFCQASLIYDLEIFTSDGAFYNNPAVVLFVEVSAQGSQVRFEFHNDSTVDSAIARVYFDDGDGLLSSIASLDNGPGTAFSTGGSPPNVPAGNTLAPAFQTSAGLIATADSPPPHNGINPGEWMAVIVDLAGSNTLADVKEALDEESLRIGAHVIAFSDGSSESAVSVPEPVTMAILILGGLALWVRRVG